MLLTQEIFKILHIEMNEKENPASLLGSVFDYKISDLRVLEEMNQFIGCDGKVLSNELLEAQLQGALEREDFEDAAKIRDELQRRAKI